jgi:hypothetical protein
MTGTTSTASPRTRPWHMTRVVGTSVVVDCGEVNDRPGTCAGCLKPWRKHSDEQLTTCAAMFAPTLDEVGAS